MFRSKTVIVVGAGASAEFEVPTGYKVFESALQIPPRPDHHDSKIAGFSFANGFDKFLLSQRENALWERYEEFVACICSSASSSIDRLAWLNPHIADLCRAYSAWSIFKSLYNAKSQNFEDYGQRRTRHVYSKRRSHYHPIVDGSPNWIASAANKWVGEAETVDDLDPGSLTFVTFNYDRIIEESFQHFVSSSRRFWNVERSNLPNVHHVHGGFPKMPDELSLDHLIASQNSIRYIEDGGNDVEVAKALAAIEDAEHIICVGFDFDPKNVGLVGLENHTVKLQVLNYDGNEALQNRVVSLGATLDQILSGTHENPLGVSLAFGRGFLDRAELLAPRGQSSFVGLSKKNRVKRSVST